MSAYYKLAKHSAYSFLLESVEGQEKIASYSFIARDPTLVFTSQAHEARILRFVKGKEKVEKISFDGSKLPKGTYLVEVYNGNVKTVKKVVKM